MNNHNIQITIPLRLGIEFKVQPQKVQPAFSYFAPHWLTLYSYMWHAIEDKTSMNFVHFSFEIVKYCIWFSHHLQINLHDHFAYLENKEKISIG